MARHSSFFRRLSQSIGAPPVLPPEPSCTSDVSLGFEHHRQAEEAFACERLLADAVTSLHGLLKAARCEVVIAASIRDFAEPLKR
jgi:hypothetical protein